MEGRGKRIRDDLEIETTLIAPGMLVFIRVLVVLGLVTPAWPRRAAAGVALFFVARTGGEERHLSNVQIAVTRVANRQGLESALTELDTAELGGTSKGENAAWCVASNGERQWAGGVVANDGDRATRRAEVRGLEPKDDF
jgi:hypothetical protein